MNTMILLHATLLLGSTPGGITLPGPTPAPAAIHAAMNGGCSTGQCGASPCASGACGAPACGGCVGSGAHDDCPGSNERPNLMSKLRGHFAAKKNVSAGCGPCVGSGAHDDCPASGGLFSKLNKRLGAANTGCGCGGATPAAMPMAATPIGCTSCALPPMMSTPVPTAPPVTLPPTTMPKVQEGAKPAPMPMPMPMGATNLNK
ncbi:MAG: hypothetical protein ACRCZF_03360 [Gemmataceae bacterium]